MENSPELDGEGTSNPPSRPRRPSLPVVPFSFLLLVLIAAGLYWFFRPPGGRLPTGLPVAPPTGEVTFRTYQIPGGALHTNGFSKTEELRKDSEASWRGTTSTGIRVTAVYRYEINLRSDWRFYVDEKRKVAFVLAPPPQPQIPVAYDTRSVEEWSNNGWARMDKDTQLAELRAEISPYLAARAKSPNYLKLARLEARKTVEEFISDWLLKERGWSDADRQFVKVYFADEQNIPFPPGSKREDFLP